MPASTPFRFQSRKYPFKEYQVKHQTRYEYGYPVSLSYHHLHLQPRDWSAIQHISDFHLQIEPQPMDFLDRLDFFGNHVHSFSVQEPHDTLDITTSFRARVISSRPPLDELTISCAQVRKALHGDTSLRSLHALQYIYPSPLIPWSARIEAWSRPFFPEKRPFIEGVLELCHTLKSEIVFDPKATAISTSVEEFFDLKRGVCQDFSQLMISCIRSQDLPARYMSGYILTLPREGEERLEGADASHAWVAVYIPGFGWIEIDPTNDLVVNDQHIRLAVGRDFGDVSLVKGSLIGGGNDKIHVGVTVTPIESNTRRIDQPAFSKGDPC
jgi:transglutaminase-like putative cysteine protease